MRVGAQVDRRHRIALIPVQHQLVEGHPPALDVEPAVLRRRPCHVIHVREQEGVDVVSHHRPRLRGLPERLDIRGLDAQPVVPALAEVGIQLAARRAQPQPRVGIVGLFQHLVQHLPVFQGREQVPGGQPLVIEAADKAVGILQRWGRGDGAGHARGLGEPVAGLVEIHQVHPGEHPVPVSLRRVEQGGELFLGTQLAFQPAARRQLAHVAPVLPAAVIHRQPLQPRLPQLSEHGGHLGIGGQRHDDVGGDPEHAPPSLQRAVAGDVEGQVVPELAAGHSLLLGKQPLVAGGHVEIGARPLQRIIPQGQRVGLGWAAGVGQHLPGVAVAAVQGHPIRRAVQEGEIPHVPLFLEIGQLGVGGGQPGPLVRHHQQAALLPMDAEHRQPRRLGGVGVPDFGGHPIPAVNRLGIGAGRRAASAKSMRAPEPSGTRR